MGSNKNKNKPQVTPQNTTQTSVVSGDSDIFKQSANDPRGRVQNRILDESSRYRNQADPFMSTLGEGFGGAIENANNDYGDLMGRFRDISAGANRITPSYMSYSDPFKSYGDFEEMSKTGGYDPNNEAYAGYKGFADTGGYSDRDIADLRSRGVAPIRAAYANAEREVGRQRSLQGGYSPNATAVLAKMAREQSQSGADALQNVNAGIIDNRNQGKLSGLQGMAGIDTNRIGNRISGMQGMAGIEGQRLGAELDTNRFNATANMDAQRYSNADQLDALKSMGSLYGTTPGMANMFGSQLGDAIQNSGQMGNSYITQENAAQLRPGQYDQTKEYANDAMTVLNPFLDSLKKKPVTPTGTGYGGGVQPNGTYTQGVPAGTYTPPVMGVGPTKPKQYNYKF